MLKGDLRTKNPPNKKNFETFLLEKISKKMLGIIFFLECAKKLFHQNFEEKKYYGSNFVAFLFSYVSDDSKKRVCRKKNLGKKDSNNIFVLGEFAPLNPPVHE